MSALEHVKIVSQLLDLQIIDKDERSCGVVDDIELSGEPGKQLRVDALLVGPGAYERRMSAWLYWLVTKLAGDRMARVPASEILEVGSVVKLKSSAEKFGLHVVENKVAEWIPRKGAL